MERQERNYARSGRFYEPEDSDYPLPEFTTPPPVNSQEIVRTPKKNNDDKRAPVIPDGGKLNVTIQEDFDPAKLISLEDAKHLPHNLKIRDEYATTLLIFFLVKQFILLDIAKEIMMCYLGDQLTKISFSNSNNTVIYTNHGYFISGPYLGFNRTKLCKLEVEDVLSIAASERHCVVLNRRGELFTTELPRDIKFIYSDRPTFGEHVKNYITADGKTLCPFKRVSLIAACLTTTYCVDENNDVFCSVVGREFCELSCNVPSNIRALAGKIIALSCGSDCAYAVTEFGYVYDVKFSQDLLRLANKKTYSWISNLQNVVSLQCGYRHSIALTSNGELYGQGNNDRFQLGLPNLQYNFVQRVPEFVRTAEKTDLGKIVSIGCGRDFSVVLNNAGDLFMAGETFWAKMGRPWRQDFIKVDCHMLSKVGRIVGFGCGLRHLSLVNDNGEIYSIGDNRNGQLGIGTLKDRNSFTKLKKDIDIRVWRIS